MAKSMTVEIGLSKHEEPWTWKERFLDFLVNKQLHKTVSILLFLLLVLLLVLLHAVISLPKERRGTVDLLSLFERNIVTIIF